MLRPFQLAVLYLLLPLAPLLAQTTLQFRLGKQTLERKHWFPVDQQEAIGFSLLHLPAGAGLGVQVQVLFNSDKESLNGYRVHGETRELALGPAWPWVITEQSLLVFALGLARVEADLAVQIGNSSGGASDAALGYWAELASSHDIGERLEVGLGVRYSKAKVDFEDMEVEAGGLAFYLALGLRI